VKTRKNGILFLAVVAGIMLSSAITLAVIPAQWIVVSSDFDEITAEELDAFDLDALGLELGYSDDELSQFCSANELAGSNEHVKEYKIPTACTQPLAITVDHNGIVWFAQTNTGKIAKFDPLTETFTEYDNSVWKNVERIFVASAIENNAEPTKLRSMMWGIDYFPDGSIWFTDEATDAIWKFSIDDESYNRISYSQTEEGKPSSLPQKLVIEGSKIIIKDFTGGRLSFLDYAQNEQGLLHYAIPSVMEDAVTSDLAIDSVKNVWYTNWIPSGQGILVKFEVILGRLDRQIQMAENVMDIISTGITIIQTETSNKLTKLIVWLTVAATAVLVPNTVATIFGIPDLQLSWSWVAPILVISTVISAIVTYRFTKQFSVNPFGSKRLQRIGNKFRRK